MAEFADNLQLHRFEMRDGAALAAEAQYKLQGDTIVFTHTEVKPGNEGKGLGSKIAKFALDTARDRKLKVVAQCEFIAGYIAKHPEYAPLLAR